MSVIRATEKAVWAWEESTGRDPEGGTILLSRKAFSTLRTEELQDWDRSEEPGRLIGLPIEVVPELEGVRVGFRPPPTLPASLRR